MKTLLVMLFVVVGAGLLVADGVEMYAAQRTAARTAEQIAQQAVQTFLNTHGNEEAAERLAQAVAAEAGVELVDLSYHKGTTRWFEVTVRARSASYLLKHLPFLRDQLAWEATSVLHF